MCFYDCICLWLSRTATMNSRQLKRTWVLKHFKRGFAFQMVGIKSRIYIFWQGYCQVNSPTFPLLQISSPSSPTWNNSLEYFCKSSRKGRKDPFYVCTYIKCIASLKIGLRAPDLTGAQREQIAGFALGVSTHPHAVPVACPAWTILVSGLIG